MPDDARPLRDLLPAIWANFEWTMVGPYELGPEERKQVQAEIATRLADIVETEEVIANLYQRDADIADGPDDDWYWETGRHRRTMFAEAILSLGRRVQEDQQRIVSLKARLAIRRQVG